MEHIDSSVVNHFHPRSSYPCEFCQEHDPKFRERRALDQMVATNRKHSASAHLTEDGYVRHRVLEVRQMVSRMPSTAA